MLACRSLRAVPARLGLAMSLSLAAGGALAQDHYDVSGTRIPAFVLLDGCPSEGACAGPNAPANPLYVAGSFSATLGGFQPSGNYATLTAASGASSAATALPSGAPGEIVVYNNGAYPASIRLGGADVAATAANDIVAPGGWIGLGVGPNTYIAAWGIGGASALVVSGGSGLPAGSDGGGGGGGGGSNASVGTIGSTAPGSATLFGAINGGGDLAALVLNADGGAEVHVMNSVAVTGAFWQATQPVSVAALPLPTGAATAAGQPALNGDGGALAHVTNFPATQPASGASGQFVDGWNVTEGTKADAVWSSGPGSIVAILKAVAGFESAIANNSALALPSQSSTVPVGGVSLCDGANGSTNPCTTPATIKPGSTPAAAGDKALVVALSPDNAANTTPYGVVNGASLYQAEPASTSITALSGGGGGAAGDYLSHCTVIPTTVSPGVFTISDGSTAVYSFPGGASSLSNLVPWTIPVGAKSQSGAWKVTTGAGLSIVCVGRFT